MSRCPLAVVEAVPLGAGGLELRAVIPDQLGTVSGFCRAGAAGIEHPNPRIVLDKRGQLPEKKDGQYEASMPAPGQS